MKIIVFRTTPMTSMGFVIDQIIKKFEPHLIDVVARVDNKEALQKIKDINKIYTYDYNTFEKKYFDNSLKKKFLIKYDLVIIPINGNLYSYKNVVDLAALTFNKTKIIFCDYNKDNFIKLSFFRKLFLNLDIVLVLISFPVTIIIILFYFFITIFFQFTKLIKEI